MAMASETIPAEQYLLNDDDNMEIDSLSPPARQASTARGTKRKEEKQSVMSPSCSKSEQDLDSARERGAISVSDEAQEQDLTEPREPFSDTDDVSDLEGDGQPKQKSNEDDFKINENLAPLKKIDDIFAHMVHNAIDGFGLRTFIEALENKTLIVATMCSGTESPLLALELIKKGIVDCS